VRGRHDLRGVQRGGCRSLSPGGGPGEARWSPGPRPSPSATTPATVYAARPKAAPSTDRAADTHDRVRHHECADGAERGAELERADVRGVGQPRQGHRHGEQGQRGRPADQDDGAGGDAERQRDEGVQEGLPPREVAQFAQPACVELVQTVEVRQLKACPLDQGGCGWLFLDRSRNGSRRWCTMDDCGAHAKARRLTERRRRSATGKMS
jgi:hypothetical protein